MSMEIREWCEKAWNAAAELPAGIGRDLRAGWEAHASRKEVVVTFYGPYDSGKSSLLKRLLIDASLPVPDWLIVTGRRETFEIQEAAVLGVVVRDTPGIAGGNERHDRVSGEALPLSDVVVLVLPPQIVTSDREAIVTVMNGTRFNCPAEVAYADRGLVIVLARMDEAGAMPRDDLNGYQSLVMRKCEELGGLFRSQGIPDKVAAIYPVSADPFGLIGNAVPKSRTEYDLDCSWDGVAAFEAFLEAGGNRPPQTGVVHDQFGDTATDHARRHAAAGGLDFRQFGHRGSVGFAGCAGFVAPPNIA